MLTQSSCAAGIGAGLSHSPVCSMGKERYVFFSFPHIGIDSTGVVGAIHRPGRANSSAACGALIAALAQIKASGLEEQVKKPGVHDPLDPEFSILKQRLARRIRFEGLDIETMDLVGMTKVRQPVPDCLPACPLPACEKKCSSTFVPDTSLPTSVHA